MPGGTILRPLTWFTHFNNTKKTESARSLIDLPHNKGFHHIRWDTDLSTTDLIYHVKPVVGF